ncbi:MAG: hypothetical protein NVSMB48_21530 [Marmoricola sp.]
MPTGYCTILATNYLPKALALADSLREHEKSELHVLLIDAETSADLPEVDGVRFLATDSLGVGLAEVRRLAMSYDLVEFATAVKPLLLKALLEDHEHVAYIDPDMYAVAPLAELSVDLAASEGGILLTPHFLRPPGPEAFTSEAHMLHVGVFNLGFIAVDRRALDFLDWWWARLREECLFDILGGLFVDQKWMDVGSVYFRATAWQHPGYNVSVVNLDERTLGRSNDQLTVGDKGEPLRLFHFHAFDPEQPHELSTRFSTSTAALREGNEALRDLCVEYAQKVVKWRGELPPAPEYRYNKDTTGRVIGRRLRRAYRQQSLLDGPRPPSPFDPADAASFAQWRRSVWPVMVREAGSDVLKASRAAAPAAAGDFKRRFPALAGLMRRRVVTRSGLWG